MILSSIDSVIQFSFQFLSGETNIIKKQLLPTPESCDVMQSCDVMLLLELSCCYLGLAARGMVYPVTCIFRPRGKYTLLWSYYGFFNISNLRRVGEGAGWRGLAVCNLDFSTFCHFLSHSNIISRTSVFPITTASTL